MFSERRFHTKPTPTSNGTRIFVTVLDYSRIPVPPLATVQLKQNPNEVQVCNAQKMNVTKTKMRLQKSKAHQNWRRIRVHTSAKISFTRISWQLDHPSLKSLVLQLLFHIVQTLYQIGHGLFESDSPCLQFMQLRFHMLTAKYSHSNQSPSESLQMPSPLSKPSNAGFWQKDDERL
jgi:hypothetical protein